MGKRELVTLLNLSSWCLVMVERLFLTVPRGCLRFVIVVFPDHTHLLFLYILHTKWGLVVRGHLEPLCMFIVTSKTNFMFFKQHPWLFTGWWRQYLVRHSTGVTDWVGVYVTARILTGTYLLQKNRNSFSGGTVDLVWRHCRLEDEDLLHVLAWCPAYFEIRKYTVQLLKDIVVRKTNLETWYSYAKDWSVILKVLVCSETLVKALPALQGTEDEIERLSSYCFHKIHVRKLQLENIERSVKMAAPKG